MARSTTSPKIPPVIQSRTEITGTPKKTVSAIPIQTRQRDERFDTTELYCVMHD
jgi:hypothetical protein